VIQRFDDAFRTLVAARCATFVRQPAPALGAQRAAGVAITLVETETPSGAPTPGAPALLLTRRAAALRAHAGQWALPGGRCDAGESAVDAALRELAEETGLALGADQVLGTLDDYPTRSGYLITPVIVWAAKSRALVPNPDEVASIHRIALDDVMPDDAVEFFRIPESERTGVRLRLHGDHIYAPTAAMIYQFRELLAGRVTRVADFEQPVFAWQ
jgi:8-oxo-dGTP pyrophosphatase MutT (NUDIX family)